jgi:hypothetical protein
MVNQIIAYYNQICYDNSNPTPEPTPTPDPTPTTTVDKDAATKVIGVLGELYDIAGDDKIKTALHTAADAIRDASGIPKQS